MSARFTHRPGSVLGAAALLAAVVAVGVAGPASLPSLAAGVLGVGTFVVGVTKRARSIAALGAFGVLACVLVAGAAGLSLERLLPSTAAAVLAWEFGASAFAITTELGDGTVERAELLHVGAATGAAVVATGLAYAAYRSVDVGISVTGVTLLLIAAVALGLALRQ